MINAPAAILAYAQLYAYGLPEDAAAAGMTDSDIQNTQIKVIGGVLNSFRQYPLTEANAQLATTEYLTRLHKKMNIRTRLKVADEVNPIVALTATVLDNEASTKLAEHDDDLFEMGLALGKLQAQGLSDEQIKSDGDFQKFALKCLTRFTKKFPFREEATIDVVCQKVQGADGKNYWAPVDPEAIAKFVTGQL